jgi:hypothetical protein
MINVKCDEGKDDQLTIVILAKILAPPQGRVLLGAHHQGLGLARTACPYASPSFSLLIHNEAYLINNEETYQSRILITKIPELYSLMIIVM